MKTFNLSDDTIVVVKKRQGSQYVIMKQKKSDVKYVKFTANRYTVISVISHIAHIYTVSQKTPPTFFALTRVGIV